MTRKALSRTFVAFYKELKDRKLLKDTEVFSDMESLLLQKELTILQKLMEELGILNFASDRLLSVPMEELDIADFVSNMLLSIPIEHPEKTVEWDLFCQKICQGVDQGQRKEIMKIFNQREAPYDYYRANGLLTALKGPAFSKIGADCSSINGTKQRGNKSITAAHIIHADLHYIDYLLEQGFKPPDSSVFNDALETLPLVTREAKKLIINKIKRLLSHLSLEGNIESLLEKAIQMDCVEVVQAICDKYKEVANNHQQWPALRQAIDSGMDKYKRLPVGVIKYWYRNSLSPVCMQHLINYSIELDHFPLFQVVRLSNASNTQQEWIVKMCEKRKPNILSGLLAMVMKNTMVENKEDIINRLDWNRVMMTFLAKDDEETDKMIDLCQSLYEYDLVTSQQILQNLLNYHQRLLILIGEKGLYYSSFKLICLCWNVLENNSVMLVDQ